MHTTTGSHRLAIIAGVILLLGGLASASDQETREYPFPAGGRLEIDLEGGGSVIITGWDREEAQVGYFDTERDIEDHHVSIVQQGEGLEITSQRIDERNVSHRLTFEIRVPHQVDLEFHSLGGGLELTDLEGIFEGETAGGSLTLAEISGDVHIRSGGGPIEVSECRLDGKLTTGGGEVLLENVVGDLQASSGGGNVQYKNVRGHDGELRAPRGCEVGEATENSVLITTAGGPIRVREAPNGACVRTGGGDIRVSRASRFVEAWTGGGDIQIEVANGWVDAGTGAGDIDVEVQGTLGEEDEGVELFTGMGNITITVPPGLSVELNLEIGYTRNSKRDFEIESDLDLEIERSRDWSYENGSPRKFIWGTASLDGGRYPIKIRTVNGDIRIRVAK